MEPDDHNSSQDSGDAGVRLRCPHCLKTLPVPPRGSEHGIPCPNCGMVIDLVEEETVLDEEVNLQWGPFKLLQRVGTGAFGVVWKARDTELDRIVAIKAPRHGHLKTSEIEQFLREARATAQLRHPNIVSVHEVGRANDSVYIVSDFIEGISLADWISDGPVVPREAATIGIKIAEGLHHAHTHGVIHRDLKPQNILLNSQLEPYIADFGLARREEGEVTVTIDGKILGTPGYMSPEQAHGDAHQADARTDIYSLGIILFQMLCGRLPFTGSLRKILHQILHEEAPNPRKLVPGIPRDLDTICRKCLEKDPDRRYSTAQELADDLRRFLADEAIVARPIAVWERSWRWARRKPVEAGLIGLVSAMALGGVWMGARLPATQADALDSLAVIVGPNDPDSRAFSADVSRRMIESFQGLTHLSVATPAEVFRFESNPAQAREAGKILGTKAVLAGTATYGTNQSKLTFQLLDVARGDRLWEKTFHGPQSQLPAFERGAVESVIRNLGIDLTPEEDFQISQRDPHNPQAFVHYLKARQLHAQGGLGAFEEAIRLYERAIELDPSFGDAYTGLAALHIEMAYYGDPRHFEAAQEWVNRALALDENLLEAHVAQGLLAYFLHHQWLKGAQAIHTVVESDVAKTELFSCYLHAYDALGQNGNSVRAVRQALVKNPNSITLQAEMGCVQYYAGQFKDSLETYNRVRQLAPNLPTIYWGLGRAYAQLNNPAEAIHWLRTGSEKPGGDWSGLLAELGYCYVLNEQESEGLRILTQLKSRERDNGEYIDPYCYAMIYAALSRQNPENSEWRTKMYANLDKALQDHSPWIPSLITAPKFQPFHQEERFQTLLTRLNYPQSTLASPSP